MARFPHRSTGLHLGILCSFFVLAGLAVSAGCNRDKIDSSKFQAAKDEDDLQKKRLDSGTNSGELTSDNSLDTRSNVDRAKEDSQQAKDDTGIVAVDNGSKKSIGNLPTKDQFGDSDKTADVETGNGKTDNGAKTAPAEKTLETAGTRYSVPDGANEVLAFLRGMDLKLAKLIKDEEPNEKELLKIHQARMEGAEKLLNVPELRMQAVQIKLDAMILMSALGQETMREAALEFSTEIAESDNPEIADFGLVFLLESDFRAMTDDPTEETTNKFMASLKSLIEKRGESSVVQEVVTSRIGELFSSKLRDQGIAALQVAADTFKTSEKPSAIENGKMLAEHLYLTKVEFDLASNNLSKDDPATMERLVEATEKALQNPDVGPVTLSELRRRTLYLESIHAYDHAGRIYELIAKAFADHPDAKFGKEGQKLGRNGMTRVALVGKPLTIEGYTMAQQELDWSLFKNNVVIVNFWSASNQICVPNLAELQQFVKANEGKAFKLVAVNVDEDPNAIVAMFAGRNPPWTNIVTNDLTKTGFESPMAVKCGIDFVPYSLLIDRAGNVADIDVIGKDLEQRVANLLGEEMVDSDGKKIEPVKRVD